MSVAHHQIFPALENMNHLLARISADVMEAEPADKKEFPPLFTKVNDARNILIELIWELDTPDENVNQTAVKTKTAEVAEMVQSFMAEVREFYATR
jgi:hypothetical protein